jgi:hypothetical protein
MSAIAESREFSGTMPVRPDQRFDVDSLRSWMTANLPGFRGPIVVVTLHETVRLRRFWIFAAGNGETRKGLSLRICCKYENVGWASASSLIFTASNRMLCLPLQAFSMRL